MYNQFVSEDKTDYLIFIKIINRWHSYYNNTNIHYDKNHGGVFNLQPLDNSETEHATAEDVKIYMDEMIADEIENAKVRLENRNINNNSLKININENLNNNNSIDFTSDSENTDFIPEESLAIEINQAPKSGAQAMFDKMSNHLKEIAAAQIKEAIEKEKIRLQEILDKQAEDARIKEAENKKRIEDLENQNRIDNEKSRKAIADLEAKHANEKEAEAERRRTEKEAEAKRREAEAKAKRIADSEAKCEQRKRDEARKQELEKLEEKIDRLENYTMRDNNRNSMMRVGSYAEDEAYNSSCNKTMGAGAGMIGVGAVLFPPLAAVGVVLCAKGAADKAVGSDGHYTDLPQIAKNGFSNESYATRLTLERIENLIQKKITQNLIDSAEEVFPHWKDNEVDKVRKLKNRDQVIEAINNLISNKTVYNTRVKNLMMQL